MFRLNMKRENVFLSMEGFEGLVKNDWGREKLFHSEKGIDMKFQVSVSFTPAIQSSFIHALHFPQWKLLDWWDDRHIGKREGTSGTKHPSFRVCPIFDSNVLPSHSRAHTRGKSKAPLSPLHPPNHRPPHLWLLFFIQLYQTWIFIEEIFPFSLR